MTRDARHRTAATAYGLHVEQYRAALYAAGTVLAAAGDDCPSCGRQGLVKSDGYIVCPHYDCLEPWAADDVRTAELTDLLEMLGVLPYAGHDNDVRRRQHPVRRKVERHRVGAVVARCEPRVVA